MSGEKKVAQPEPMTHRAGSAVGLHVQRDEFMTLTEENHFDDRRFSSRKQHHPPQ